jgi:hypothetical protein
MRRLTLVRLLLSVILINIVLTGLFVLTVAGNMPWLAHLMPGEVGFGAGFWGNYVFLSLAVLINAALVLGTGFIVLIPAIFDDEPKAALEQINAARWIFRIGALLFILAFPVVCFTVARAQPQGAMFIDGNAPVWNTDIRFNDVALFTTDQVISAITFDAPEIFGRRLGDITFNRGEPSMPPAVLIFRIVVTLTFLTALIAAWRESTLASRLPVPPANGKKPEAEKPA